MFEDKGDPIQNRVVKKFHFSRILAKPKLFKKIIAPELLNQFLRTELQNKDE